MTGTVLLGIDLGTTRTKVGLISTEGEPLGFGRAEHATRVDPAAGSAEQEPEAWWVGQSGPNGFYLSDEAVDWVDEVANGETPERRGSTTRMQTRTPRSASRPSPSGSASPGPMPAPRTR